MTISELINWLNADPIPTREWMRQHYSHFDPYDDIVYYTKMREEYRKKLKEKGKRVQKRFVF